MADKDDKQFDPTPQRLRKAREEGNVFKAQDMVSVVSLMIGMSVLVAGMPAGFGAMKTLSKQIFLASSTTTINASSLPPLMVEIGSKVMVILLPFMLALMVVGVGMNVAQSGWNVTMKPLEPKPEKISPIKGMKRIFSAKGLFTTFKSVLKILIVGPIAYFNITGKLPEILMLHTLALPAILSTATQWIVVLLAQLIIVLFILSAIDFAFEKWKYKEDLKMSKQEIKDEAKESEGNPQVKVRRRQIARDIARRPRLDHAVLKADVVVTNPTHYAVMLRYDPEEAAAPIVLAKGIRKRALRIKALAKEHGVPTVEDRPLARALYATVEETQEIPPDLYPAVAAVLAEIYRLKGKA